MKVSVRQVYYNEREELPKHQVFLSQGGQSFAVGHEGYNKAAVVWLAKMLRKAIKAHDAEVVRKGFRL